jgi:TorA maturation chaperone TorD
VPPEATDPGRGPDGGADRGPAFVGSVGSADLGSADAADWRTVARLFAPPDPGGAGGPDPERLPPALAERWAAAEATDLATEYVRLFVNALPEVPCPPYASVYLEGGVYGSVTGRVRERYRKWGVDTSEVPDHFAVEAAFLAALLEVGSGEAADAAPDVAADLAWLTDHLRAWAPTFLRSVREHDRTGVYAEAASWSLELLERTSVA